MAPMHQAWEYQACGTRIKNFALDFQSEGCNFMDLHSWVDEYVWWDLLRQQVNFDSMLFYFEFCRVIGAAPTPHAKEILSDLSDRLFSALDKMYKVVMAKNFYATCDEFQKVGEILEEVIEFMIANLKYHNSEEDEDEDEDAARVSSRST
ncbi:hypothetical protein Droror1_Dr00002840 [Drosera rotundifolia]